MLPYIAYMDPMGMIYIFTLNLSSIVNLVMFTNLAQILGSYQINQLSPSFANELSPCFPPCSMVKFHSSTSFSPAEKLLRVDKNMTAFHLTNEEAEDGRKFAPVGNYYPYALCMICMVYFPTCGSFLGQMLVNIAHMEHMG